MPVLVAVSDKELAAQADKALSAAGHRTMRAADRAEALARQHEEPLPAVVLDVAVEEDLDAVSVLLAEGAPAIVVLTADEELGLRAIALGAQDHLPPYDPGLVAALRRALVRRAHDPGRSWVAMLDGSSDAVVVVDRDLVVRRFNCAAEQLYGRTAAEVIGRPSAELAPEEEREIQQAELRRVLAGERLQAFETVRLRPDGTAVNVSLTWAPIANVDGERVGVCAILRDITELVSARDLLAREHARLEASQAAGQVGSWELDLGTMMTEWSAENALLHGLPPLSRRLSMEEMLRHVHPDDHTMVRQSLMDQREFTLEYRVVTDPEDVRVLVSRGAWLPGDGDHPGYLIGTSHDVTAEREARRAKRLADEQFRRAFETGIVAMAIADADFRYVRVNDALCDFFGRSRDQLLGRPISDFGHPDDADSLAQALELLASGEEPAYVGQRRYLLPGGQVVWAEVSVSAVRLPDVDLVEYIVQLRDVTAIRTHERALRELADRDPLTSVLNRRAFDRELRRHLGRGGRGALLMVDLDGFKGHNDAFGHPAGDVLLVEVAGALREHLRGDDVIGRIGGDEFVVLLADADPEAVEAVATRLVDAVRSVSLRVAPQRERPVTASVGIAEIEADPSTGSAQRADDLVLRVDAALYEAKHRGRDTWVRYAPEL